MKSPDPAVRELRYERKYRIEAVDLQVIRQTLRLHPAGFRTLYPDRLINNIYYDLPDFSGFKLNLMGVGLRRKYRLRWYGPNLADLSTTQLEIKQRENELGSKQVLRLPPLDWKEIPRLFRDHLPAQPGLRPTLLNRYRRSYLGIRGGRFRITIDWKQAFLPLYDRQLPDVDWLSQVRFSHSDPAVILELKYDASLESEAGEILQHIPFRQSRNSKYVNGVKMGTD